MTDLNTITDDPSFISDCCRYMESLISEAAMRRKYSFLTEKDWQILGDSEILIAAVDLERLRRVRDGSAKRESAQRHIVRGPDTLARIMDDPEANHRHVVDAIKTLDALADPGPEHAPMSDEKYSIVINLGADLKLHVNKQHGLVDPHDSKIIDAKPQRRLKPIPDRETDDTAPQELLPLFAATKRTDDGNGEPL